MSTRMAVCRITLGMLAFTMAGCASLSRTDSPFALGGQARTPKESFVFRDGRGAARANSPAALTKTEDNSAKPKGEPESEESSEADTEPKLIASLSSDHEESDAQSKEKPSDAPKVEKKLSLYSSKLMTDPGIKDEDSSSTSEELYVLDAQLKLSPPKKEQAVAATEKPEAEAKPPTFALAKADPEPASTPAIAPPPIKPIPVAKLQQTSLEETSLPAEPGPPLALNPTEPASEKALSAESDPTDEHLPMLPAISRSDADTVTATPQAAKEDDADLPPIVAPISRSEPGSAVKAESGSTAKAKPAVEKKAGMEVADSPPPAKSIDLRPLISAIDKVASSVDDNTVAASEKEPAKESKESDTAPQSPSLTPVPPAEVVALKPSQPELPITQPTVPPVPQTPTASPAPEPVLVEKLTLCRQILGFGKVEPFASKVLHPGQQVLLYAEIANFESVQMDEVFETELASVATIETEHGTVVAPVEFDPVVDRSESKRTDFYCHYRFQLPESLMPGDYVLRLRVKDLHRGEFGEGQMAFKIGSLTK